MRVLFVAVGCEQLNVSLLASILRRAGHEVGLAFTPQLFDDGDLVSVPALARLLNTDDVVDQAARFAPDVVCYSALTVMYRWMISVAEQIKERLGPGVINVFGGVHASAVPEIVLEEPSVDYVCVGEGDVSLPMLLEELARGQRQRLLPNIGFRGPDGRMVKGPQMAFVQDLDSLPPFEKDLWLEHIRFDSAYMTMSSRGCPYRCTFCFNNFFANTGGARSVSNKYVRQRSVDHMLAELRVARRRYGTRHVTFLDDVFTLDTGWMKEFSRRYRKEIGVPYRCLTHVHFLDEERVEALRESGCVWVQIGVQSVDEKYKKQSLKRPEKGDRMSHVLNLLHRAGIGVKTDHMFGLPGETLQSQEAALAFYADHPAIKQIATYWLTYLPGTEIMDEGLAAGSIDQATIDRINRGYTLFWHREANVKDAQARRAYLDYETLFRLLVLMPPALRAKLRRQHVSRLPGPAVKALSGLAHAIGVAVHIDPDLRMFFGRYRQGLQNFGRKMVGRPPRARFGKGETGPLSDPAWDALYQRTTETLKHLAPELDTAAANPAPLIAEPARERVPLAI